MPASVDKQNSYEYQNTIRDLSEVLGIVITKDPVLSSLIGIDTEEATNTKHEWLEDTVSPVSWTIKAGSAYASGSTSIKLVSNAGVKVGDILEFEKPTGARSTLQVKITSVNDNHEDVGISVYGGSADENLAAGTYVQLLSRPKNEASEADADNGREPTTAYNQTQIFDRTAKVSKTAQSVAKYGIANTLNFQVKGQIQQMAYELCRAMYRGRRVMRSSGEAGTMGGLLWYMQQAIGNKVDAGGLAISEAIINDGLELGKSRGALNLTTLLCSPTQARRISRFNRAPGSALLFNVPQASNVAGSYVSQFVGELGTLSRIVVDETMDKDKIAIIDPTKTLLTYLKDRRPHDMDATPNGADYFARRILMEATLTVRNPETQILITGLPV